ncbi:6-phosphogluconolactonase [Fukomys damarensis]|uniref:6-phosphogluconolactonase n=1 Tax=Fukomys damarensis TaxID=885580 RepID=UPI00053F6F60|nr:6-phosphogluconolactonase [Fukomys damarensis]
MKGNTVINAQKPCQAQCGGARLLSLHLGGRDRKIASLSPPWASYIRQLPVSAITGSHAVRLWPGCCYCSLTFRDPLQRSAASIQPCPGCCVSVSILSLPQTHLLSRLPVPDSQVITIDPQLPVEAAAEDYARKLRQAFQGDAVPVFDLLLLGVGPDGHTCSLFPDHPLLQERDRIVAPISDSPKPPPQRVTLTLPVLNAARTVVFVATGEGKASVLKRILEDKDGAPLPAALVQPHTGTLRWFLDEAAARLLSVPFEKHSTL